VLNAPHVSVGQLRVRLISPSGTQSLLASPRTDTAPGQFNNYELTSVRCWDEFADGAWTLTLADEVAGTTGTFIDWSLRIFGTEPACPADWNMDGAVDPDDLFAFLDSWFGGAGDFDQAGGTTPDDLFAFLDAWFAGWGGGSGC
jgi:subtilisin-like proprotein convertase family protein